MADNPFLNCGDDWQPYTADICTTAPSGMDAMYLLKPGVAEADYLTMDAVDPAKVQTLIDAGKVQLLPGLMIGYAVPAAITTPSFIACTTETAVNYTWTLTIKDQKVTDETLEFWDSVNAVNSFYAGGFIIHECGAGRIRTFSGSVTIIGGPTSPEGDELQRFEMTATWKSKTSGRILPDADIWTLVPTGSGSGA